MPAAIARQPVQQFFETVRRRVLGGREFGCLVTTDAELRRLNREFRGKDYATDVLSFPAEPLPAGPRDARAAQPGGGLRTGMSEPGTLQASAPLESDYLGDLAISWQRARSQAGEFGHPVETEIQVLMLHGALHLNGMDHETDRGQMSRAETRWRRALGLPAGLIERVRA